MKLTDKEKSMIKAIAHSEYNQANGSPSNWKETETWADMVIESRSDGGVFSSLAKKGLATHYGKGREAVILLTEIGFGVYVGELGGAK